VTAAIAQSRVTAPLHEQMASPNPDTITDQESRFVEAYLVLGNGKQAAVEAGYSPRTAAVAGSRLLRRKRVKMAIDARQIAVRATAEQKTGITFDRLLHELATAAFCDPGELFGPQGRLLTLEEMPERLRRAIKQCDVVRGLGSCHRGNTICCCLGVPALPSNSKASRPRRRTATSQQPSSGCTNPCMTRPARDAQTYRPAIQREARRDGTIDISRSTRPPGSRRPLSPRYCQQTPHRPRCLAERPDTSVRNPA
jgi:hypothetical protein